MTNNISPFLYLAWAVGVAHVPELDNIATPPDETERPKPATPKTSRTQPVAVKYYKYGADEPGRTPAPLIPITTIPIETESGSVGGWIVKSQTTTGTVNDFSGFAEWHQTDDEAAAGLSATDLDNYQIVRPDVIAGLTNKEIASKHGKKIRWAETHAGRVRAAMKARAQLPPTG
jgi:hypothetical protein